jgi:hypothetical protein
MHTALATLIDRLDSPALSGTDIIEWGAPIPCFGDLSRARVATLGLNPSNKEFLDKSGDELVGVSRRFHTLKSLNLGSWAEVDARHLRLILESCRGYFELNPYDRWFRKLDKVVGGAYASYYGATAHACHLDLIPYATSRKWTQLTRSQRSALLAVACDILGILLRDSPVRVLILNGSSVVDQFENIAGISLEEKDMPSWSLSRGTMSNVPGIAYWGEVESVGEIRLGFGLLVLGFNHNVQSSFGVTNRVMGAIRRWISRMNATIA